jgi:hypothetical protein
MSGVHSPLRLLLSSLHPSALVSQRLWSACLVVSNVGVGRDAPRLVASEQLGRRSPSRLTAPHYGQHKEMEARCLPRSYPLGR